MLRNTKLRVKKNKLNCVLRTTKIKKTNPYIIDILFVNRFAFNSIFWLQ